MGIRNYEMLYSVPQLDSWDFAVFRVASWRKEELGNQGVRRRGPKSREPNRETFMRKRQLSEKKNGT